MNIINKLYLQFARYWSQASLAGRSITVLAGVIMLATIVGTAIWSSTPDYKLLRDGISPVAAGEMVSVLDASGIPNRLNYSGTGIMVPTSRWNQANVAISGIAGADEGPTTASAGGIFPQRPEFDEKLRKKEVTLERSISSLRAVKTADVHLAVPEPSPFRKSRAAASASVIVEPTGGMPISRETGETIVRMVGSAVEGLSPENVTLTTSEGVLIGRVINEDPAVMRSEYRRNIEVEKAMAAQEILASALGEGKSTIRVSIEIDDFLDKTVTRQKIISEDKVRLIEKITTVDQKGGDSSAGGVAGTGSNGPSAGQTAQQQQSSKKESTNETTYDYPREEELVREVGGKVVKLSVSGTVDVTRVEEDGTVTSLLTKEQVEDLVMRAVNFQVERGDQISVVLAEMPDAPVADTSIVMPDTEKWAFVADLARNASLGLAAVVALLIGMMTLRKITPIEVGDDAEEKRRQELVRELSMRVDRNPEAVSKILAAWLAEQENSEENESPSTIPMSRAA